MQWFYFWKCDTSCSITQHRNVEKNLFENVNSTANSKWFIAERSLKKRIQYKLFSHMVLVAIVAYTYKTRIKSRTRDLYFVFMTLIINMLLCSIFVQYSKRMFFFSIYWNTYGIYGWFRVNMIMEIKTKFPTTSTSTTTK